MKFRIFMLLLRCCYNLDYEKINHLPAGNICHDGFL
jgi:hypothetical protein